MSASKPFILDPVAFDPASISEDSKHFNAQLPNFDSPHWYEIGAAEFRRRRAAGETKYPPPVYLESAEDSSIPSRDADRVIPIRILKPQDTESPPRGVFMHIHGGGWVLGDQKSHDLQLQDVANNHSIICVSVGYRLAPEHPFPAGPQDCYDAAEWLILHAQTTFNAPLIFLGGESAGAHLSMLTALHLLRHQTPSFAAFRFKALLLHYGCYDASLTASVRHLGAHEEVRILNHTLTEHFREAFLPGWTGDMYRDPEVSPLHSDLYALRGRLPPVLFTCGTRDILMDDTLFMSVKWLAVGGEAVVEIVPGAQHGFTLFPRTVQGSGSDKIWVVIDKYIEEKIGK